MLLNDKRYRSYTFQFFALFVLICIIAYLGKNLVENPEQRTNYWEKKGKKIKSII